MTLLRDVFWVACLLMIVGVISASGLRYSTHWNTVEIGPIPTPAAATKQIETEKGRTRSRTTPRSVNP